MSNPFRYPRLTIQRLFFSLFLGCATLGATAQVKIVAEIVSTEGLPIGFARVGIHDSQVSTLADELGQFELLIPKELVQQKLTIQVPGYKTTTFSIDSLSHERAVRFVLASDVRLLDEVTVSKKRPRTKKRTLGNRSLGPYASASYGSQWTLVTLIELKETTQINKLKIRIASTERDSIALRPAIFAYDSVRHIPGQSLLEKNLYSYTKLGPGWFEYELSNLHFYTEGAVCVGFEILSTSNQNGDVSVSASMPGKKFKDLMWERAAFTFPWQKASNAYLIKADVEY